VSNGGRKIKDKREEKVPIMAESRGTGATEGLKCNRMAPYMYVHETHMHIYVYTKQKTSMDATYIGKSTQYL
jgi:hypothetical protein